MILTSNNTYLYRVTNGRVKAGGLNLMQLDSDLLTVLILFLSSVCINKREEKMYIWVFH